MPLRLHNPFEGVNRQTPSYENPNTPPIHNNPSGDGYSATLGSAPDSKGNAPKKCCMKYIIGGVALLAIGWYLFKHKK